MARVRARIELDGIVGMGYLQRFDASDQPYYDGAARFDASHENSFRTVGDRRRYEGPIGGMEPGRYGLDVCVRTFAYEDGVINVEFWAQGEEPQAYPRAA